MIAIGWPSGKRRNRESLLVRRDRVFRLRFLGGRLIKWVEAFCPHTPLPWSGLGIHMISPAAPSLSPLSIRL